MHLQKFLRNLRKVPVFANNKSTHNIEVFIGNIFDAHILNFTHVLIRQGRLRLHFRKIVPTQWQWFSEEVIMETFGERR